VEKSLPDSKTVQNDENVPVERQARVNLFGYDPVAGTARLFYRDPFWRGSRALMFGGAALVIAPVALLVPPHGVWTFGALGIGSLLARRKWTERRTLTFLEATCPRCEAPLRCLRPTRMREPHTVTCESCHYEMELQILDE
jgi:hypothetical protein